MGRGRERACAAALAIGALAWPSAAAAQDSIDVQSRFAIFEEQQQVTEIGEEPFRRLADRIEPLRPELVENRLPNVTCVNIPGATADQLDPIRRVVNTFTGSGGVTLTSNAAEADGGDPDTIITALVRAERARRSAQGRCLATPRGLNYDPRWAISAYAQSATISSHEDNGPDASQLVIGFNYNRRLGEGNTAAEGALYRTRWAAQLENGVLYSDLYQDWIATTHDARLTLTHTFDATPVGATVGVVSVGQIISNPDEITYDRASLGLVRQVTNIGGGWGLKLSGGLEYRNYTEAPLGDFDEIRYTVGATLSRAITPEATLELGFNYTRRESDVPAREFEAGSMPLSLRIVRTFGGPRRS